MYVLCKEAFRWSVQRWRADRRRRRKDRSAGLDYVVTAAMRNENYGSDDDSDEYGKDEYCVCGSYQFGATATPGSLAVVPRPDQRIQCSSCKPSYRPLEMSWNTAPLEKGVNYEDWRRPPVSVWSLIFGVRGVFLQVALQMTVKNYHAGHQPNGISKHNPDRIHDVIPIIARLAATVPMPMTKKLRYCFNYVSSSTDFHVEKKRRRSRNKNNKRYRAWRRITGIF